MPGDMVLPQCGDASTRATFGSFRVGIAGSGATVRCDGTWTLVHTRHADVATAIHQGNAFLSRLEGEWWLRFQGG